VSYLLIVPLAATAPSIIVVIPASSAVLRGCTSGTGGSTLAPVHSLDFDTVQIVLAYVPVPTCSIFDGEERAPFPFAFNLRKYSEWLNGSERLGVGAQYFIVLLGSVFVGTGQDISIGDYFF
jgi:hypothetical protein